MTIVRQGYSLQFARRPPRFHGVLATTTWCQDRDLDPVTSDVSVVLSFLKGMLDKQHSSSTIKVYTAAIAAFHVPISGLSVCRASAVITFVQGSRRINLHLHLHLVILQTLLPKATYNWGIHKAINLEESTDRGSAPNTKS